MDIQKIKNMLSREVLAGINGAEGQILRAIIFDDNTSIDWNKSYDIIMAFMPELKRYDGYKIENME